MSFESIKFGSPEKKPKADLFKESTKELALELKKPTVLEKLRNTAWFKRLIFLAAFLSATEAFGQNKEKFDFNASVESSKKALKTLEVFLNSHPDRKGEMDILGLGHTKFVEKNIGDKKIHSNDFYFYIKEEKIKSDGALMTQYGVDIGKDGTVDEVVIVPGKVDKAEEASIVNDFTASKKEITTEAELASLEREAHDEPSLHRQVIFLEKATGLKWYIADFENGTVKELQDKEKITVQAYWEAKTNLTAAEIKGK